MSAHTDGLPRGWRLATLPDLVAIDGVLTDGDWVESVDQDPNGEVRLTQLADVGDGVFRDRSDRYMTRSKAAELRCTFLEKGDVMIARMPDPLGRACLFPGSKQPCVTVVDVCIVRPGSAPVHTPWLMHFINAPQFRAEVASLQAGSTRKRISKANLSTIALPVPPPAEQREIAAAIESHFSRLDAATATLERVQRNLERYRASVLKTAVEGRLVPTEAELAKKEGRSYEPASVLLKRILAERRRRWEEAELAKLKAKGKPPTDDRWKSRYEEPAEPDTDGLPELPEGWCWATAEQLASSIRNGCSTAPREKEGVRILRISAVRSLACDVEDVRFLPEPLEAYQEFLVQPGDLLFTRYNGTRSLVGVGALVRHLPAPTVHPDKLIRVQLVPGCDPGFVELATNVGASRRHVESRIRTTAGQAGVSGADIKTLPVPLPPAAEQARIREASDELLTVALSVSATVMASLARSARARQSILKWAFEGRLIEQGS
jgi:type I restriction enzyme, S subunit